MRIKSLSLKNFRRFKKIDIDFHPELTVIVANNGQGKTSLLDAATIVLGTFIGAFDFGKAKSIEQKDAHYHRSANKSDNEQVFPVRLEAVFSEIDGLIVRELTGTKTKTTIKDAAPLTNYGKHLMAKVRSLENDPLPLMSYYGSGRLWNSHKNTSRKAVLSASRTLGYEDCFTSASSFTQVQQWMTKATFASLQQEGMSNYDGYTLKDQIQGIQNTVDRVLASSGWSGFHYSLQHEELAMTHQEVGVLPVSLLSDGVRAMVSLVADMAWRCAKLNPYLGANAQQETSGIAFIDEVDMHLHPSWQQTVVSSLKQAFPNIQFVITTHSPQVLSTVPRECIRVLTTDIEHESIAATPLAPSYGEPSNDVLHAIMHVNPQPPVPEKALLDELTSLVDQGEYKSAHAKELLCNLKKALNEQHPQIQRIERSIRRQEALKR